jgi:hypothetical protein
MIPGISLPWARWVSIPFGLFSAAMAGSAWSDRGSPPGLLLLAGSSVFGYVALSLLLNSTSVRIKDGFIVVRHWPLPWLGKRLPVADVAAVTVASRSSADTEAVSWELTVVLRDGRTVRLTSGPIAGHRYKLLEEAAASLATSLNVPLR